MTTLGITCIFFLAAAIWASGNQFHKLPVWILFAEWKPVEFGHSNFNIAERIAVWSSYAVICVFGNHFPLWWTGCCWTEFSQCMCQNSNRSYKWKQWHRGDPGSWSTRQQISRSPSPDQRIMQPYTYLLQLGRQSKSLGVTASRSPYVCA